MNYQPPVSKRDKTHLFTFGSHDSEVKATGNHSSYALVEVTDKYTGQTLQLQVEQFSLPAMIEAFQAEQRRIDALETRALNAALNKEQHRALSEALEVKEEESE